MRELANTVKAACRPTAFLSIRCPAFTRHRANYLDDGSFRDLQVAMMKILKQATRSKARMGFVSTPNLLDDA